MTQWSIQAEELANCNCNFGCPCQFSVAPTDGTCEAAVVYDIQKGNYGGVSLDGLRAAGVYKWPGAIHEGNGEMQLIIDENASDEQRAALQAIMTGQDTEEMATMWFVFSAMAPNRHETLYAPISVDVNLGEHTGSAKVGNIFDLSVEPIPNIVSGDPHKISINLPHGFEFNEAHMASGGTKTKSGAISLKKNSDTHAHLARLHLTGAGVVRH